MATRWPLPLNLQCIAARLAVDQAVAFQFAQIVTQTADVVEPGVQVEPLQNLSVDLFCEMLQPPIDVPACSSTSSSRIMRAS